MKQYLNLLSDVKHNGTWQDNRTGVRTLMIPGAMLKFDLRDGFPAVTTKKLAYRSVVGELLGFLNGAHTVAEFNALGCRVWDANGAATNGELGPIYGVAWRQHDQIGKLLETIRYNPQSRRMIVTAWLPDLIPDMALPPCHYSFQIIIEQSSRTMHLIWNQRSCDLFLGIPFNIASYATLLSLLACVTGYNVGTVTDVHIYENHLSQVEEQLSRAPLAPAQLWLAEHLWKSRSLDNVARADIELDNYVSHPAILAPMAL